MYVLEIGACVASTTLIGLQLSYASLDSEWLDRAGLGGALDWISSVKLQME